MPKVSVGKDLPPRVIRSLIFLMLVKKNGFFRFKSKKIVIYFF